MVTDDMVRTGMKDFYKGYSGRFLTSSGINEPIRTERSNILSVPENVKKEKQKVEGAINLTTKEREFLDDVAVHETSNITDRYSRLGLSGNCYMEKMV